MMNVRFGITARRMRHYQRAALAMAAALAGGVSLAQSDVGEGPMRAFAFASVLPSHAAADPVLSASPETGEFTARGVTVAQLVGYAYDMEPSGIVGGPDWVRAARYQVDARPPEDFGGNAAPNLQAVRELVRGLLIDHFGLEAHRDRAPLYILEPAGTGVLMRRAADEGEDANDTEGAENAGVAVGAESVSGATGLRDDGRGGLQGRDVTSAELRAALEGYLARPVLDRTGLTETYDLELRWDPTDDQSLPDALRRQLGLSLRSVPVDIVVIDDVGEQPAHEAGGGFFEVVPRREPVRGAP